MSLRARMQGPATGHGMRGVEESLGRKHGATAPDFNRDGVTSAAQSD